CALLAVRVGEFWAYRQRALGLGQTAFIIALSVERIGKARTGLCVGTIERDSTARQCLRRLECFQEISPTKISRLRSNSGHAFVATGKARIEIYGLLKKHLCESIVLGVGFTRVPETALIRRPGIEAPWQPAHSAVQ